jgi:exopolyphosphatase/guanosine-5'-triphosphate,3'-diphosphate pyrophosphatase
MTKKPIPNGTRLAAVDLGSNSFRLEIGRVDHGQFLRTEYLKETIRQGSGLDENRNLTPEAMQRGWECLSRFGERLAGFDKSQVRAVATQTLREARNREQFLARGKEVLGFEIDVISGREEARLIYQGVAHVLPQSDERRLVVDIGGRSTELILGQGFHARVMESYRVGSIAWSTRYFPNGQFTPQSFQMAEIAAKALLDEALNLYQRDTWDQAYGSAGTVGAVGDVLTIAGWPDHIVTRDGLDWLQDRLIKAQTVDKLRIEGMKDDRRAVIGGGLSVLRALFDLLNIDQMHAAAGGLRHGLLYDILESPNDHSDVRSASMQRLARKFEADAAQGARVGKVAVQLFNMLQPSNGRTAPAEGEEHHESLLTWAAQVHEIGSQISHSDYHKHGAYILDNADAMGFTQAELHRLSLLVLGHRGKLRKLDADLGDAGLARQLLCLRLGVLLCHARRDPDLAGVALRAAKSGDGFVLGWRAGWADTFPQSAHLLREEVLAWQKTPWSLELAGA